MQKVKLTKIYAKGKIRFSFHNFGELLISVPLKLGLPTLIRRDYGSIKKAA